MALVEQPRAISQVRALRMERSLMIGVRDAFTHHFHNGHTGVLCQLQTLE